MPARKKCFEMIPHEPIVRGRPESTKGEAEKEKKMKKTEQDKKRRIRGERDEKYEGPRIRSREIAASFLGRQLITDIMF